MPTPSPRPELFTYLDHRAFLRDWFDWKKQANARFSHRMFARLAGMKSPSMAMLVMRGERNLSERSTLQFAKAMSLSADETDFYRLLVQLERAPTPADRAHIFEQISGTQRFRDSRRLEGEGYRYLSNWYIPAIRELALCPEFRAEAEWIARTMRPPISVEQAQSALDTLDALGMVVVQDDRSVRVGDVTITTPHEVTGLAVHNFHYGMLDQARASVEGARPFERHLGAVTVAVSEDLVPRLKREIATFQEHMLAICDGHDHPPDRVYQLNLQLFPLTHPVSEDSS